METLQAVLSSLLIKLSYNGFQRNGVPSVLVSFPEMFRRAHL